MVDFARVRNNRAHDVPERLGIQLYEEPGHSAFRKRLELRSHRPQRGERPDPRARIAIVISNKPDAGGIETAKKLGIPSLVIPSKGVGREEHDRAVVAALQEHKVDLICLAGYMRLLSPWFVQQFPQRILNIHPSLLPAFPGLEAQQQAFAYGVKVSGCTVHFVDEELDHGAIIVQKAVTVLDSDDEHTLAEKILEQEHIAYSEAIGIVLEGKFKTMGRRLVRAVTAK